jgi:hypothetical protein
MKNSIKLYSELIQIPSFIERYRYLKLGGKAGEITFGNERYLNQVLYKSREWKSFRREIIIRDDGCDLGLSGYSITGVPIIHHINPITIEDVVNRSDSVFDPENVICVSRRTHNAIHYGDEELLLIDEIIERIPNDTIPWRK